MFPYAAISAGFPSRWRMFTCRKSLAAKLAPAAIVFRSLMIIAYVPRDPMLCSGTVTRIYSLHEHPDSYILTKLRYDRISPSRPTSNANVNYGARVPREKRERTSFLASRYLRGNMIYLNLLIGMFKLEHQWSMAVNVLDSNLWSRNRLIDIHI